jgi:hypothetical protein
VSEVSRLASMDSQDIADLIKIGPITSGTQDMKDLARFYPEKYAEVQALRRKEQQLSIVNTIST